MKHFFLEIYSLIQKSLGFRSFGSGSVIKFPYKIWNKDCISIGKNVFIAENSFLSLVKDHKGKKFSPELLIGENSCIGADFHVSCTKRIEIQKNVLISDRVFIGDGHHDFVNIEVPILDQPMTNKGEILLKEGCFIGINVVILPGVTVGKNSFVGASSVVTSSIPDYAVAVGNPARIIKKFNQNSKKWERV